MIGEFEDLDIFHDCRSDDEENPDVQVGGGDEVICKQAPRFDDPVQIRAVLERAATATQRLLRCYGGTDCVPTRPLMTLFYPATLGGQCPSAHGRQVSLPQGQAVQVDWRPSDPEVANRTESGKRPGESQHLPAQVDWHILWMQCTWKSEQVEEQEIECKVVQQG
ncbi:GD20842 [Drosophila simulans]|uniref:GD20842 n=1 Tax=Drosophila simulans TaxID=7240 RepID=B4QXX6_DROSI|nr:GD20842 [Drosophila simulans]